MLAASLAFRACVSESAHSSPKMLKSLSLGFRSGILPEIRISLTIYTMYSVQYRNDGIAGSNIEGSNH